jgi:adenylate cyclase
MADIFVSYARQDKARVAPLVAALEREGYSVWWDPAIAPGQEFDRQIAAELDAARAVIVVWTPVSVDSRWVRGEAREAADRGILVPVRFEAAKMPLDVRSLHTTDLDHWGENPTSVAFKDVVRALSALFAPGTKQSTNAVTGRGDDFVSIAVLPFVNMSADPDQEYFSDGLSEELINQLVKIKSLRVAGRTSSFVFKGKTDDLRSIGNKLGVNHVLEGSVRKAGQRLRITAQLINCRDGFHLWSDTYDRRLDDVFAIQDEVAAAVAKSLGIAFGFGEAAPPPTARTNFETYDKYLRARAGAMRSEPAALRRSVALLREALALDPDYAPAHAGLVGAYTLMMVFLPESIEQTTREMTESVQDTLARLPDHWAGHLAKGVSHLVRSEWLAADSALARGHALAQSFDPASSYYALLLSAVGRSTEAVSILEAARNVDPLSPTTTGLLQAQLDVVGRPDAAQTEYERTLDLPGGREIVEHEAVIRIWPSGSVAAIRAQAQRFLSAQGDRMQVLRQVYEVFDQPRAALELLSDAFDDPAYQDPTRLMILGWYAAHFGDNVLALAAMRRAFVDKRGFAVMALWYPVMGAARKSADFKQLVRDIGLYDYWRTSGRWGDFVRSTGDNDFEVVR